MQTLSFIPRKFKYFIIIIIIRQLLCHVVGRRPQHAVSKLSYPLPCRVAPVFVQVGSKPLGWSPLSFFLVIWSPSGDTRGPSVVFEDHLICLTVLLISMTFVLSLTQMLVVLSLYVMLSILLSILVCAAASLFCACLVSVQVSAPYVVAGSTH